MILVDTSVWIDVIRRRRTNAAVQLVREADPSDLAITDPVLMEVLAGARDDLTAMRLRHVLTTSHWRRTRPEDYVAAATIYRRCREAGTPARGQVDCLIAAVAIRLDIELLARDRDYATIARAAPLRLAVP